MSHEMPVAIVTGSAEGLGYAIVKELLDNTFKVCMSDINEDKGKMMTKKLQDEYGDSNVTFYVLDVAQRTHYIEACEYVVNKFKRMDLIVNNAGIIDELNPKNTIDVNLMGPIYGCEMASKYMGKDKGGNGGMVINVSSLAGLLPAECLPVYAASKHGIVGLTRSYGTAYHYAKSGVMFTALCPCAIKTNILETFKTVSLRPGVNISQWACLMTPSYVAKAAIKLLEDKKNGSILAVTEEKNFGYKYIGLGELDGFTL